jgi:DNA-damage-inducible protein D
MTQPAPRGQAALEDAAFTVGRTVRETMISLSGLAPERLPLAEPIPAVKNKIKGTNKKFRQLDGPKRKLLPKPEAPK